MQEAHYAIADCPLSIALLSDLHDRNAKPVLASLRSHRPDIIAITGDFANGHVPQGPSKAEESPNAQALLHDAAKIAPTYVSLGNHEWVLNDDDLKVFAATGCTLLDNQWVMHDGVAIGGLTSARVDEYRRWRATQPASPRYQRMPVSHYAHAPLPRTEWLDDFCAAGSYRMLLSHHPEYWPWLKDRDIHLVLSGHAHGGQWQYYSVRNRQWKGVFAPGQGWFPQYTSGVYDERLVVSRGLANTIKAPRFFNPRQVVYINC